MKPCLVGIVLVTHSAKLGEGVAEVAAQMAPDVPIRAAGGCLDGRIGTSYERVERAVKDVLATEGIDAVVLLTDLGSAALTAGAVLEGLDDPHVVVVDAPLVEGAVAGAVAAQTGGDCAAVRRAVRAVGAAYARAAEDELADVAAGAASSPRVQDQASLRPAQAGRLGGAGVGTADRAAERTRTARLTNKLGLHARPAALLARTAGDYDADVRVNGVSATSVLELMALNLELGAELRLSASGSEAGAALDAVEELVVDRFGEE